MAGYRMNHVNVFVSEDRDYIELYDNEGRALERVDVPHLQHTHDELDDFIFAMAREYIEANKLTMRFLDDVLDGSCYSIEGE